MAEWYMPVPPPQYAEEVVAKAPEPIREWDPNHFLICTFCRKPIEHGEEGIDIVPGVSGFGPKSGKPMLVDVTDPLHQPATLHYECVTPYLLHPELSDEDYYDYEEEEEVKYCAACDAKLDGDTE